MQSLKRQKRSSLKELSLLVLFFFMLAVPQISLAGADVDCLSDINSIVEKNPNKKELLEKYLRLQSEITLHKLAYAFLKNEPKEGFRVENKILSLLENMKDQREDSDFNKIYDDFKDPNNKLSRNALANVLPYLIDILNKQNEEVDPDRREALNLGTSDIRMLSILAEKESVDKYGRYASLLSSRSDTDSGILNFIKIINSSVRNTNAKSQEMVKTFETQLNKIHLAASKTLEEIFDGAVCNQKKEISCITAPEDASTILKEGQLASILKAVESVEGIDKDKELRYGDVWLRTSYATKKQKQKRSKASTLNKSTTKTIVAPPADHESVIHEYLIDHVLNHMPYFFEREDLKNDKSLTLGLAQAIDAGVLTKKGRERKYYYKGEAYYIPELWNKNYEGNRVKKILSQKWDNIGNTLFGDKYVIPKDNGVKSSEEQAFVDTWQNKKENQDQKIAFSFKGKLYKITDGSLIAGTKDALLSFKLPASENGKQLNFNESEMPKMYDEINMGNRSYLNSEGKAVHISGVPVDFEMERTRAKRTFDQGNLSATKLNKLYIFPDSEKIKSFAKEKKIDVEAVKKTFADKKIAFVDKGVSVNLLKLKIIDKTEAIKVVENHKDHFDVNTLGRLQTYEEGYLQANAVAILNKKNDFKFETNLYDTRTGRRKKISRDISASSQIAVSSLEVKKKADMVNNKSTQLSKVIAFHKNYTNRCEQYVVIDKNEGSLNVYNNEGHSIFSKEVLVGKTVGDERTLYRNYHENITNDKTGAGIYFFGKTDKSNVLHLNTQNKNSALSLSAIPKNANQRRFLLNDNDPSNNRVTNGSINLESSDFNRIIKDFSIEGCPLYVLPETKKSSFYVEENSLSFKTNCSGCDEDFNTYAPKVKSKPISAYIVDNRYKSDLTESFVDSLVSEKKDLLPLLGITNEEYDQLAKLSFGVMGVESDFGSSKLYKFKESKKGQLIIDVKKNERFKMPTLPSMPFVLSPIKSLFGDNTNNSRGATQIKHVDSYLKGKYRDQIKTGNLNDPKNAAVATMFVLASKLKSLKLIEKSHSHINDTNRMQYLYYLYMGSTDQVKAGSATPRLNSKTNEVIQYSKGLEITTVF